MDGTELITAGGFEIKPCDNVIDLTDEKKFTKLKLTQDQKAQVNALVGAAPSLLAAGTLSQSYVLTFPEGIQGTLMKLKRGGYSTTIVNPENGKILGTAALEQTKFQSACLSVFTAMSIATGQYFLSEINSKLNMMKLTLDKILEFLYGDKRAELMAEVNFVRYAYENYISIMGCEEQRVATIASLQGSRKIAMKDIEFYISDLESTIKVKPDKDISGFVQKTFRLKESLEFAMQLYGMSSLLEVHYAQNYDRDYLEYVETDILGYIDKCEKRMLGNFSSLRTIIESTKDLPFKKTGKIDILDRVDEFVETLGQSGESEMKKSLKTGLNAPAKNADYYMTVDGAVYMKTA